MTSTLPVATSCNVGRLFQAQVVCVNLQETEIGKAEKVTKVEIQENQK